MDRTRRHALPRHRHHSPRRCRWAATLAHQPLVPEMWLATHSNRASNDRVTQLHARRYDLVGPSSDLKPTPCSAARQAPRRMEAPLRGDFGARTPCTEAVGRNALEPRFQRTRTVLLRSEIRSGGAQ